MPDESWSGLTGAQQACKTVFGQVPAAVLLLKTARSDTMDVGFLVWQLDGDKCLMLPTLDITRDVEVKRARELASKLAAANELSEKKTLYWIS